MYFREFTNHYETLGVARDAAAAQIKKSYKILSIQRHPDKNFNCRTATEDFQKLNEAYSTLSDPEKRIEYNEIFDLHIQECLRGTSAKRKREGDSDDSDEDWHAKFSRTTAGMKNRRARDEWQEPEVPETRDAGEENGAETTSRSRFSPRKNGLWAPFTHPDIRVCGDKGYGEYEEDEEDDEAEEDVEDEEDGDDEGYEDEEEDEGYKGEEEVEEREELRRK